MKLLGITTIIAGIALLIHSCSRPPLKIQWIGFPVAYTSNQEHVRFKTLLIGIRSDGVLVWTTNVHLDMNLTTVYEQ